MHKFLPDGSVQTLVTEDTIRYAEALVRETGYNYAQLKATGGVRPVEAISRASHLYDLAKELLHRLDPCNARSFIESTYGHEAENNG